MDQDNDTRLTLCKVCGVVVPFEAGKFKPLWCSRPCLTKFAQGKRYSSKNLKKRSVTLIKRPDKPLL
jgi:hypothetical protein